MLGAVLAFFTTGSPAAAEAVPPRAAFSSANSRRYRSLSATAFFSHGSFASADISIHVCFNFSSTCFCDRSVGGKLSLICAITVRTAVTRYLCEKGAKAKHAESACNSGKRQRDQVQIRTLLRLSREKCMYAEYARLTELLSWEFSPVS